MLESIKTWISNQGFMVSVFSAAFALNCCLSGLSMLLQKIDEGLKSFMDKTQTQIDNGAEVKVSAALAFLSKANAWLQKVVDFGSANRAH